MNTISVVISARRHPSSTASEAEEAVRPPPGGAQQNGIHQLPPETHQQLQQTSSLSPRGGKNRSACFPEQF